MRVPITISVNGEQHQLEIDTRLNLVSLLRDELGLTGAHVGCSTGNCGACTVMLGSRTVKSCCVLAADVGNEEVVTIEALSSSPADLHPIQQAFVENQGLQCGFCTPGMVLSALHLLQANSAPSEAEIRHAIAGNLCRCTGYELIVKSIAEAGTLMAAKPTSGAPA